MGVGLSPIEKRYLLYGESTLDIILTPLRIFWEGRDNSIAHFDGVLNPFYLPFFVFAFLGNRENTRYLSYIVFCFALSFAVTLFTVDLVTRYLMPFLPAIFIVLVKGVRNSFSSRRLVVPGVILLLCALAFNVYYISGLYRANSPIAYLFTDESRDEYLLKKLPDYKATVYANENLPEDAKVMFLFTGDRGGITGRESTTLGAGRERICSRLFVAQRALVNYSKDSRRLASRIFLFTTDS